MKRLTTPMVIAVLVLGAGLTTGAHGEDTGKASRSYAPVAVRHDFPMMVSHMKAAKPAVMQRQDIVAFLLAL